MLNSQTDVLGELVVLLNTNREKYLEIANSEPGNDMARQRKWEAIGSLRMLDEIAEQIGLATKKVYSVK